MNRKKMKWSKLTIYSICLLIIGIVGYYGVSIYNFANRIHTSQENSRFFNPSANSVDTEPAELNLPPKWEGKQRVNILLLGGDARGLQNNAMPRSDSNIVVSIDPVSKQAFLFSILRDTYVDIPGHGMDRINAALALGGPYLAMSTVSELMDIPIQYYVYTDFEGFKALVDAVDGIDYYVEKDMKWTDNADKNRYDIDLKKGQQHLDGDAALQYVRFRHDAMSDFARTERQRNFMAALADKLQTTWSVIKLPKILSNISPFIETNISWLDMLKLAALGFDIKTDQVKSLQMPPNDMLFDKNVGGAEVLGVNTQKLREYVRQLFTEAAVNNAEQAKSDSTGDPADNPAPNTASTPKTETGGRG